MPVLRGDRAGNRLSESCSEVRHVFVGNRQQTASSDDLLSDKKVLRQVSRQRVADGHLAHSLATIAVALAMIDRRMVDRGLDAVAPPDFEAVAEILPNRRDCDAALVTQLDRETRQVPTIQKGVVAALRDQFQI